MFRKVCHLITDSNVFKKFILLCISGNTVLLACSWYGQSEQIANRIELVNLAFFIIYTLEFLMKVIALRTEYF
jgi:uncharacterized protein (DUF486 family)